MTSYDKSKQNIADYAEKLKIASNTKKQHENNLLTWSFNSSFAKTKKNLLLISIITFLTHYYQIYPKKINSLGIDIKIESNVFIILSLLIIVYFLIGFLSALSNDLAQYEL